MEKNEIIALVLICIVLFFSFGFVLFASLYKQRKAFKEFRKSFGEHKDEVILREIRKLENPVTYYKKTYDYIATFVVVKNQDIINLYVESYFASDLFNGEKYVIEHDGLVMFECKKKISTMI